MVTANIVINQAGHPIGYPGQSRDDLSLHEPVELSNYDDSGVITWNWTLLAKPNSSLIGLDTPSATTCRFAPDVAGSYLIRLVLNGRTQATVVAAVKTSYLGLRIPATGETTEMDGWSAAIQAIVKQLEDGVQFGGGGELIARVEALEVADDYAFHRNITNEFSLVDEKAVPEGTDALLIEDSTDGASKKRVHIGNLTAHDSYAFHRNIADEFSLVDEKAVPEDTDVLLIEDSTDGASKKRVQIGSLAGGGGGFQWARVTEITAVDSPYQASYGELVLVVEPWSGNVIVTLPAVDSDNHLQMVCVKVVAPGALNTVDVEPYLGDVLDDGSGAGTGIAYVHGWNTGPGLAEAGCCVFQCLAAGSGSPRWITLAHYYRVMIF